MGIQANEGCGDKSGPARFDRRAVFAQVIIVTDRAFDGATRERMIVSPGECSPAGTAEPIAIRALGLGQT